METEIYKSFRGHELLKNCYGHWPSFTDSEVVSLLIERNDAAIASPNINLKMHTFRIEVAETDPRRDNRLVTFFFRGVMEFKLFDFNHQNPIEALSISNRYAELLKRMVYCVTFTPAYGMDCSFECDDIEILSLETAIKNLEQWIKDNCTPGCCQ